ncbi:maleylacetoacetate isomerase [Thalassovita litoralis]|jgi:maleylpyruvate isomerase|uniref:Maleylacetoacetate isomerase n=1 Tax=Thalassovita litoralis TaxID=1010611 RepID=A0A521DEC8_9RHOB|nr:maleylacetoacetate isomerase [Thalassovita litoralis]SMO70049.1 maleylacetoacetate isomerase [Thalassovita litoralis]
MRFLGYFRSSSAYRCRIAFNLKGLEYEFESVHLKSGQQKAPEFAAVNPQKLVPALITDDGQELYQSLAIIEWLDETYGGAALIPADKDLRAQVRAFAQVIACEIHPLQNLRVLQYLRNDLSLGEDAVNAWLARWLGDGLQACEDILQKRGGASRFCFGDEPGLADICLVPQVFSAQRFNVDISHLTRINAIYEQCQLLPAFADAHPKNQPDFEA